MKNAARVERLDVYVGEKKVAFLDRVSPQTYRFGYLPGAGPRDAVSLTMDMEEDLTDDFILVGI